MSDAEEQLSNEIFTLFPLPVYKTNIGRKLTKQEKDEFDVIISENLEDRHETEFKKISTDKYLLNGTRKPLLAIQSFIEQHLKEFVTTVLGINVDNASCNITQAWLNEYEPTASNPVHNHMNSIISGVFYINCLELPNKTDGINFINTGHKMVQDIELPVTRSTSTIFSNIIKQKTTELHRISVVAGDLIMFPSSTSHSVDVNETLDQTRISLSFNTFMFGVLGEYEKTSELILKQGK